MEKKYNYILKKASDLQPITFEEAFYLYKNTPLPILNYHANIIRNKLNEKGKVSWQIDRNVNYTNICTSGCLFCNFHCKPHQKEKGYILKECEYTEKIEQLFKIGGNQLLLQGGLHPHLGIDFYEQLFKRLKDNYPTLKLNALGPPEIAHIAKISSLPISEILSRLKKSGLDTLPGAGAEILSPRVRRIISPGKPSVEQWVDVMKQAHKQGFSTTATMVYGSIETEEERIQHLFTLRDIQDAKPGGSIGFRAFIPWPMQMNGTILEKLINEGAIERPPTNEGPLEFLRIVALSRIVLLNIQHIQASWLTIGIPTALLALHCGADDMGSIMIEENVVSSTGKRNHLDKSSMVAVIKEAGFDPWLRDQLYHPL
jgi:cyclic dehypoxanthinyl futalosine synthase